MIDLNQFAAWQVEKPDSRNVQIDFGPVYDPINPQSPRIWVFDSELDTGMFTDSVDHICLDDKKKVFERAEYERLKKIYGEEDEKECQR